MTLDAMLVVAGAGTGVLVGMTGVGGGSVMTPLLLLVFGFAPASAIGTDLWFASFTKLAATRVHHARGLIDWQVVRRLWCGSLPASAITLAWMAYVPIGRETETLLKASVAIAVLVTAASMLFQKQLHALGRGFRLHDSVHFKAMQAPLTVAAGALLGALVTLTSIGAGALGVVFLAYLYPLRLTPSRLVATDIVHAIPLAMFAGSGHLLMGNVDYALLANLLVGSIPGVLVGAWLSAKLPYAMLRTALACVLVFTGVKVLGSI
ncbi:MAG TPA: sulfite exporter TauE/SafE family protein [Ramlibacter sp.]|uniref:sulfite exporter TauE/SafE family protein n=1 Tax=Ramlibacter sp. TaxID=1917967 RepID=UPI002B7E215C|nr:sulfite exporter TauE/SafE family protein [Ramlibacter sp.]HVZ42412.1 sulfite exporter TauE/SafE family protein [Ramlibacter sp.]